ncbi:MAG: right-handed parallel beta-helix repeat-containing protein [bacterium]|nr:right-handed parallel beta-helix repeat-containing protein [bacterium]
MRRAAIVLLSMVTLAGTVLAEVHEVPGDFKEVGAALDAAKAGDTVRLAPGKHQGNVTIPDGVTLEGAGAEECLLTGSKGSPIVTVPAGATLKGLSIIDGETGVYLEAGASAVLEGCRIIGNATDGVGFVNDFNTYICMRDCHVEANGDGVDFESTQGVVLNSTFVRNRDDGLDLDGDAGALVYGCTFADNRDDGVEVRIAMRTHAIFQNCRFSGNGEDGLEIINSPVEDGVLNLLCVQNCAFDSNARHGVGFVAQDVEEATDELSKTMVWAVGNTFSGTTGKPVSANHAAVFEADKRLGDTIETAIQEGDRQTERSFPVRVPMLVGVYNLQPATDGSMMKDGEAVAVSGDRIYVSDDNSRAVFELDRRTGCVTRTIPVNPIPGSEAMGKGPEGLDLVMEDGKPVMLLADDTTECVYALDLAGDPFGKLLRSQDAKVLGSVEGFETVDDDTVAALVRSALVICKRHSLAPTREPIAATFGTLGGHVAGVGMDDATGTLYITSSGLRFNPLMRRNYASVLAELEPDLSAVKAAWHLGPFSNDPRGVAVSDNLVYVSDGRDPFVDDRTGEENRGGIKVFVFLREDDPEALEKALPLLPIRRDQG